MSSFHTLILPIIVSPGENETLDKRFNAGYQCYRTSGKEAWRRLLLLRQSKAWQQARKLPTSSPVEVKARPPSLDGQVIQVNTYWQSRRLIVDGSERRRRYL